MIHTHASYWLDTLTGVGKPTILSLEHDYSKVS